MPRNTLNAITAQLAAETAKAIRGLNLDKGNWQQVFSGSGSIVVKLPDGSTFTGPSWNGFTTALDLKAEKSELDLKAEKTDLDLKAEKSELEKLYNSLGTAAGKNIGMNKGEVSLSGDGGFIAPGGDIGLEEKDLNDVLNHFMKSGMVVYRNNAKTDNIWDHPIYSPSLFIPSGDTFAAISFPYSRSSGSIRVYAGLRKTDWTGKQLYLRELLDSINTTVDGNGFIKKASPIVKLFGDGSCELNKQSEKVKSERVSEGVYRITGTLGFNSDAAWGGSDGGVSLPKDRNDLPLIWVDYDVEPTGDLLIKTYHREHVSVPSFATNKKSGYENGMPIDIPLGRWIDLRVEVPTDKMEK